MLNMCGPENTHMSDSTLHIQHERFVQMRLGPGWLNELGSWIT